MARFEILDSNAAPLGEGRAAGDMLFELGMMYSVGRDMPVDLVAAHKWFNLAAMKGNADAIRLRREIANQMSDVEIAAAQRAARDWLRGNDERARRRRSRPEPSGYKAYPAELGLAGVAGDGAAGLRTRNWYMPANVSRRLGFESVPAIEIGHGRRIGKARGEPVHGSARPE